MTYHNETVFEDNDYRVIAVQDDYAWDHTPDYCGGDMMFSWDTRGYDGPWVQGWQGCDCLPCNPISAPDILRAANAFYNDLDMLNRWLRIVAPDDSIYLASEHYGNVQGEQYLLVERFDAGADLSNYDPSQTEPVCWARGDVYLLQAERYNDEYDMWENCDVDSTVVYGLDEYANTLATEMIAEAKADDEEAERLAAENAKREAEELAERARVSDLRAKAETYDANAKDVSERFIDETNPTRRGFLLEEITYWTIKAAATRSMI